MRKLRFSRNMLIPGLVLAGVAALIIIALAAGGGEVKTKPAVKTNTVSSACGPYRNDRKVVINGTIINAEVAKNPAEFDKGLAGRPCILPDQGMLFAFTKPGQYPFWMKDMKFPIDIAWITPGHKVAAIEIDFQPSTYPDKRVNKIPAQFVLELKANRSKELHMDIGSAVQF